MTTSKPLTSPTEKLEDDALLAGDAAAGALRGVEVAAVVLLGLLVCPPLAILAVARRRPPRGDRARPRAPRCGPLDAVPARPPLPRAPRPPVAAGASPPPCRPCADRSRAAPDRRRRPQGRPWPVTAMATASIRHLRPRGTGVAQQTTTVELFFDLVYVFAVTQLSHQILDDLSVTGVARAAFLLLIVWWAWIYTTWMANWFDPASPAVRGVLTAVMLGSLLMAAALPEAFGERALLFAASYVALQVGRNAAAAWLLKRRHRLRDVFERLVVWSAASGRPVAGRRDARQRPAAPAVDPRARARARRARGRLLAAGSRPRRHDRLRHRGNALRRALPGLHHHRARRIDRRHGSDRVRGGTHIDGRALPRRRVRRDRGAVVAVLRADDRERARHDQQLRRPRSPRARRLHLRAPADRRGHHRDRGRQPSAHRRATRGAGRGRRGDDPRRARALPARREPVLLADDRRDERQACGGRGAADPARAARRASSASSCSASSSRRCSPRWRSGSCERRACKRRRAPRSRG